MRKLPLIFFLSAFIMAFFCIIPVCLALKLSLVEEMPDFGSALIVVGGVMVPICLGHASMWTALWLLRHDAEVEIDEE